MFYYGGESDGGEGGGPWVMGWQVAETVSVWVFWVFASETGG